MTLRGHGQGCECLLALGRVIEEGVVRQPSEGVQKSRPRTNAADQCLVESERYPIVGWVFAHLGLRRIRRSSQYCCVVVLAPGHGAQQAGSRGRSLQRLTLEHPYVHSQQWAEEFRSLGRQPRA